MDHFIYKLFIINNLIDKYSRRGLIGRAEEATVVRLIRRIRLI